jgi:hypothetical protein
MLKLLRHKNVAKIVLWGILILILPAFVLWGTGNLGSGKEKGPKFVGLIDGKKVSFDDYYQSLVAIRAQIILNYFNQPSVMDIFMKNKRFLGKLAWDRLIMEREAEKLKIKISDSDLIGYIRSAPIFIRGGGFDDRIYEYVLKNNIGIYPRNFEEMMRRTLSIQRMNDILTKDVTATDADAVARYRQDNSKFKVLYALFASSDFLSEVSVPEDEIADYYERHKDEFLMPAKTAEAGQEPMQPAPLADVRQNIKSVLGESAAASLAAAAAEEKYKEVSGAMSGGGASFDSACEKAGLKLTTTALFSKNDYLGGIGEASAVAAAASVLKTGDVSGPVNVRGGTIFFKLLEVEAIDTAKFEKEKEDYRKKALEDRKNKVLEDWLRALEAQTVLNIDFADYDKYYR